MSNMKNRSSPDLQLGRELRERRRRAGLSQTQVAAAVGVSVLDVGRWERGEAFPPPEVLERIGSEVRAPAADMVAWQAMAGNAAGLARSLGVVPIPADPFRNATRPAPATETLVPGLTPRHSGATEVRPADRLAIQPAPPQPIDSGQVISGDPGRWVYDNAPSISRSRLRQWVRRAGTAAGLAALGVVLWWALIELAARLGFGR